MGNEYILSVGAIYTVTISKVWQTYILPGTFVNAVDGLAPTFLSQVDLNMFDVAISAGSATIGKGSKCSSGNSIRR